MDETAITLYLPADATHIELRNEAGETLCELHDNQTRRDIESGAIDLATSGITRIVYEYWRATQSEFRYRQPGQVDLGSLD